MQRSIMDEPWTFSKTLINLLSQKQYQSAANLGSSSTFSAEFLRNAFNDEEFITLSKEELNAGSVISRNSDLSVLQCPPIRLSDREVRLEFLLTPDGSIPQSTLHSVSCRAIGGQPTSVTESRPDAREIATADSYAATELGFPDSVFESIHEIAHAFAGRDIDSLEKWVSSKASPAQIVHQMDGYDKPMHAPSIPTIRQLEYARISDGLIVADVPILATREASPALLEDIEEITVCYLVVHVIQPFDVRLYDALPGY